MLSSPARARAFRLPQSFDSLRYGNYRLWFVGQLASLMGTWMQATAQAFLVFQLTRSAAFLGYVGFAAGAPALVLMLFGGVVSDRISQRTVLVVTQSWMMALAFILAGLTFAGTVQPWGILILAFALGIANAFDAPARQALVRKLVPRENLSDAVALNSTMFNLATVVGPALGGITYALLGPAWCFAVNGLSFQPVLAALGLMSLPAGAGRRGQSSPGRDLREGLRYIASRSTLLTLVTVSGAAALAGQACLTLLPAWAVNVLRGGPTTNGWLQSARGVGCVIGALLMASLGRFRFKCQLLTIGTLILPASIVAFSLARHFLLALLAMASFGLGMMILFNSINAILLEARQRACAHG